MFHSRCKFVRLVPHHCDFHSTNGFQFCMDCSLNFFFFFDVSYTYDEDCTYRKACFRTITAVRVAVFLARLLFTCMDIESNPGPGLMDTRSEEVNVQLAGRFRAVPSFSINQFDSIIKNFPLQAQLPA